MLNVLTSWFSFQVCGPMTLERKPNPQHKNVFALPYQVRDDNRRDVVGDLHEHATDVRCVRLIGETVATHRAPRYEVPPTGTPRQRQVVDVRGPLKFLPLAVQIRVVLLDQTSLF